MFVSLLVLLQTITKYIPLKNHLQYLVRNFHYINFFVVCNLDILGAGCWCGPLPLGLPQCSAMPALKALLGGLYPGGLQCENISLHMVGCAPCSCRHSANLSVWQTGQLSFWTIVALTLSSHCTLSLFLPPMSLNSVSNTCCRATSMPYTPATLLQNELWSPEFPGAIIDPWIQFVAVAPSSFHAAAPFACW